MLAYPGCPGKKAVKLVLLVLLLWYGDSIGNVVEDASIVFSLVHMC